jgi:N-acetylglucosaminyl-diphospho-decaprenol L-rhamnosyltransferase
VALSVVILSFGRGERFRPLLADVAAAGVSARDVLVVHNPYGPDDRWLPSVPRGATLHRMPTNVGYGAAMNAGIDAVAGRSSAVLLLTHDTRLGPDAVQRLLRALDSAPEYGVLGPSLELGGQLGYVAFGGAIYDRGAVDHVLISPTVDEHGVADAAWVDGSVMLLRTKAMLEVGRLRTDYFMYFEEPELCDRMRARGWRVGVLPAARAYSEPGVARRPAAFGYLYTRNGFNWARSHGGRRYAVRFAIDQFRASARALPLMARRLRNRDLRRQWFGLTTGRVVGLCAALRGTSGPPPALLAGDIRPSDGRG